jgi:hypothetical protein
MLEIGDDVCTYICRYVYMYVCMYICMYICMYVPTYVCMRPCFESIIRWETVLPETVSSSPRTKGFEEETHDVNLVFFRDDSLFFICLFLPRVIHH